MSGHLPEEHTTHTSAISAIQVICNEENWILHTKTHLLS